MSKDNEQNPDNSGADVLFSYFNEIGIISQLSSAMFENTLPNGLTNAQFGVLNWFVRVDSVATPGRLATAFQVTGGAMTNTLKKLEAKKLIKIEPDPESGRKKRVTITARGRQIRDQAIKSAAPLFADMLTQFQPAKLSRQLTQLQEVREYLDELRYKQ